MMRRIYILSYCLLVLSVTSAAQSVSFDTVSIPLNIRKNAAVVVRSENIEFEVFDIDHAKLSWHRVITILNDEGKDELNFDQVTDKFSKLDDFEVKVYNLAGKTVAKYNEHDLISVSIAHEFMDDDKNHFMHISVPSFPVTVEFNVILKYNGILNYPRYQISEPNVGVEFSNYVVKVPTDLDIRYKEKNIQLKPTITENKKYKTYSWLVKNVSPIEYEDDAVSYESRYPSILIAPTHFKLDDYEGDMTSWKSFGNWYGSLSKGMDQLPDDRKIFYRNLVKDAKTDKEKVKIVYDYLQKNFRYVSIQLGIGGFKPFPADYTDSKKYGDCKGLSNYLQAVLKVIGIKSYQALINARYNKEPVDPDFPCNQFNHDILCVLLGQDSIWLECTSKTNDFGTLGSFTENRNALLITETGGVLVPTPKSAPFKNTIKVYTTVDLGEDGSGKTNSTLTPTGEFKQEIFDLMNAKSDEQKSKIISHWSFKDPSEIKFADKDAGDFKLDVVQDLELLPELKTGSKMFLSPSIASIWTYKLPKAENRKQDFYFNFPFEKKDTTVYQLPKGYTADALPESKSAGCRYASYSTKYWYDEKSGKVYSASTLVLNQYKIPAKDYAEVKKFFDDILVDRQQRIVVKKTS